MTVRRLPHDASLCLGLMSGTSADGVSAALIAVTERRAAVPRIELRRHGTMPYPLRLRRWILDLPRADVPTLCRAQFELGEVFARAALRLLREARVSPTRLLCVASHGQTVWHQPPHRGRGGSTLQVGSASVIAERTGATVVSDFRPRDMAVGGQGAPLVPFFDGVVFRPQRSGELRCVQNIGGIANVTVVSRRGVELAFDTGPGNAVIDAAVRLRSGGRVAYDRDGRIARTGTVQEAIVRRLLALPFFRRRPPRSTGRERFGDAFVQALPALRTADLVATLTEFVARSVVEAIHRFVFPLGRVTELLVSGGGAANPVLMAGLARALAPIPVRTTDAVGVPGDAREAMAFALLGWATLRGLPSNVPVATGARRPVVLGTITPAGIGKIISNRV